MKRIHVTCTDCPWTGTYTSEAKATYAHRRHSCDRWNAKAEAAARGAARRAAVDRTPKPCLHKQANHVHGTHACYVLDACRCGPCAKAEGDYERARVKAHAYGRWNGYVPAGRARAHVLHLMAQGMGLKRIVKVSGVSQGAMWKLVYGKRKADGTQTPSKHIRPATEARILAVQQPDLAPGARVDATGTRRRLQALATLGWSIEALAAHTGRERQALDAIVKGERTGTTRQTADAVKDAYDALWNVPRTPGNRHEAAAVSRVRNAAQRAGYAPPLAWDDDTIDNPDATPDLGTGRRHATTGHVDRMAAIVEDVEDLLDAGTALAIIPVRVGYKNAEGLARALTRVGRYDLARRVEGRERAA